MNRARTTLRWVLAAILAAPAAAQTYYVDAANGDDANPGTSWDQAWKTISHAAASSPGASTIEIAPGLYDPLLGEAFPIDLAQRTYRGVGGAAETVVDGGGAGAVFAGGDWYGGGTLAGLTLQGAGRGVDVYVWCFMEWCTAELVLRDVVITGIGGAGVRATVWTDWFDAALDVALERVVVERCHTAVEVFAICDPNHPTDPPTAYASLVCADSLIRDNVHGVTGFGLDISNHVDLTVVRSTIAGNREWALIAGQDASAGVRSSILYDNQWDIAGPAWVTYSNTEHALQPGVGNISVDPLFLDPDAGDYRLRFGSPCADAGAPNEPPVTDLIGGARPLDGDLDTQERADMGALELAPLTMSGQARIGATVELELWGRSGATAWLYWRRGPTAPPVGTPYGDWDLGHPRRLFARTSSDSGPPHGHPLSIPFDPALVGTTFSFQALSAGGLVTPPMALTNPVSFVVSD